VNIYIANYQKTYCHLQAYVGYNYDVILAANEL